MEKYTLKQLKSLVNNEVAIDITNGNNNTRLEIENREGYLIQVGYSSGVYGCNGKLFEGHKTGDLYAITSKTNAIYIF